MNIAIVFAGGVGRRFNNNDIPKQFVQIYHKPVIIHTLEIFERHPDIDKIYISILPSHREYLNKLLKEFNITKVCGLVNGGETGQDSIYNALEYASKENPADSVVLIHDGVRPIVSKDVITENIKCVRTNGNAITCTACTETVLLSEDGLTPKAVPFRKNTYTAQAPQSFYLNEILEAHNIIRKRPEKYTDMIDSCTIYNYLGKKTFMVKGNTGNIKITNPEDVFILEALLKYMDFCQNVKEKNLYV